MQETSKKDMQEEHLKYFIKSTKGGGVAGGRQEKKKRRPLCEEVLERYMQCDSSQASGSSQGHISDSPQVGRFVTLLLKMCPHWLVGEGRCNVTALKRAVRHKNTLVTVLKSDGSSLYF